MVEEFFQTGQLNERGSGSVLEASREEISMPSSEPSLLLAGNDTSIANEWSAGLAYGAAAAGQTGYGGGGEFGFETEQAVAVPGIPLFLEQALMSSSNDGVIPFYDGDNAFAATQGNMWPAVQGGDFGMGGGIGQAGAAQQMQQGMTAQQQQQQQQGTMNGMAGQHGNGYVNSGTQPDGHGGGF